MSDAVLDRGFYFPSPMTDWYRERPFKVAFVVSLLIHALLIALVPGFRAVVIEPPAVLNVEIVLPEQPQVRPMPMREVVPQAPVTTPPPPQRNVEQTVARPEPQIEPRPEPVVRQPELEPPPIPRTRGKTRCPATGSLPRPRAAPSCIPRFGPVAARFQARAGRAAAGTRAAAGSARRDCAAVAASGAAPRAISGAKAGTAPGAACRAQDRNQA